MGQDGQDAGQDRRTDDLNVEIVEIDVYLLRSFKENLVKFSQKASLTCR